MVRKFAMWSIALLLVIPALAQQTQQDSVDLNAVYKIKDEAIRDSQVMKTLSFLSDVYGGRLTGSPNAKLAGDWALQQMKNWGSRTFISKRGSSGAGGSTNASVRT